jgi:septum site-determining protein MinC
MMVALLLKTTDLDALGEAMTQEFGGSPELFDHDPVLLDLAAVREAPGGLDFPAVKQLLRGFRLNAVAVRGGSEEQMQAAVAADLSPAPDAPAPAAKPAAVAKQGGAGAAGDGGDAQRDPVPVPQAAAAGQLELLPVDPITAEANAHANGVANGTPMGIGAAGTEAGADVATAPGEDDAASPTPADKPAHALRPTLVIDRPLRSGQQVYARGGDLVVLAAVNFGAEVIADGNIHVYAPLRGRAVAGARGDASARIFCTSMQAQLLSIAGIYRTTDTPLPQGLHGKPVQVRLDGETLCIEALSLE